MKRKWHTLPARPLINMEPCYEEIYFRTTDTHVRNAVYWSLFATPVAGVTYGANGIWPWIRKGEKILNHGRLSENSPSTWRESIDFPGSLQMGYMAELMQQLDWWELKPDHDILTEQAGNRQFDHYVSVLRTDDYQTVLVYIPMQEEVKVLNPRQMSYQGRWFNPRQNTYQSAQLNRDGTHVAATPPAEGDWVLILKKED